MHLNEIISATQTVWNLDTKEQHISVANVYCLCNTIEYVILYAYIFARLHFIIQPFLALLESENYF